MTSDFGNVKIGLEEFEEDLRFGKALDGGEERVVEWMRGYGGIDEGSGVADSAAEKEGFGEGRMGGEGVEEVDCWVEDGGGTEDYGVCWW